MTCEEVFELPQSKSRRILLTRPLRMMLPAAWNTGAAATARAPTRLGSSAPGGTPTRANPVRRALSRQLPTRVRCLRDRRRGDAVESCWPVRLGAG